MPRFNDAITLEFKIKKTRPFDYIHCFLSIHGEKIHLGVLKVRKSETEKIINKFKQASKSDVSKILNAFKL